MPTAAARQQAKDALFDAFATIARALASGRRVEIMELLAQGERTVEQIADAIGQSVANTSHHLGTLARAGHNPPGGGRHVADEPFGVAGHRRPREHRRGRPPGP